MWGQWFRWRNGAATNFASGECRSNQQRAAGDLKYQDPEHHLLDFPSISERPAAVEHGHYRDTAGDAEPHQDGVDVNLDGTLGDVEFPGNLSIGPALGDEAGDLALSIGEPLCQSGGAFHDQSGTMKPHTGFPVWGSSGLLHARGLFRPPLR